MIETISLLEEGIKSESPFRFEGEYQEFRERFRSGVKLDMERYTLALAQSELESWYRLVD